MDVIKSRLIYTAGTFSVEPELAACRRLIITSSVLRFPPTVVYSNERSNPPKYFLGYAGFFINDYCEKILPLEFDPQAVLVYDNLAIQLYYTTICAGALITDNLVRLASVLTPPALLIPLTGEAAPFPGCVYTSIKFKLFLGTRIQVDAIGDPTISCDGVPVNALVPNLNPPPPKYPSNRPRSEDPARSEPEPGELPGDTSPASSEDPDISLTPTVCTMTVGLFRADTSATDFFSGTVPNASYASAFKDDIGPGTIYVVRAIGDGAPVVVAGPFNPGSVAVTLTSVSTVCA